MPSFNDARISFAIVGALYSCACSGAAADESKEDPVVDTPTAGGPAASACAPSHEHFVDLGALDLTYAGGYSYASALNEQGTVVGYSVIDDTALPGGGPWPTTRAFRWKAETGMVDLNAPMSQAMDVNERDEIAGNLDTYAEHQRAVMWDAGNGLHELGTLGGPGSYAVAINNRGQIIGQAADTEGYHPFIWDAKAGMVAIEVPGSSPARLNDINDSGVVVGVWYKSDYNGVPFKWTKEDGPVELDRKGAQSGEALSINNAGEISGYVTVAGRAIGVKWTACDTFRVPEVIPKAWTYPMAINDQGTMVGFHRYETEVAVQWDPLLRGSTLPLDAMGSAARDVNNCGDVVGTRTVCDVTHAYLWHPERSGK